jgi:myosin-5
MGKVGIPAEQREAVFATVAAVLHLGNISFLEGKEADSSKVAPGAAQEHLKAAGAQTWLESKYCCGSLWQPGVLQQEACVWDALAGRRWCTYVGVVQQQQQQQ